MLQPGGRAALPRGLGRLERWADRDLTQFSKGCCAGDEPVESPSLEMFHSPLDMVMANRLQVALLEQGAGTR